MKLFSLNEMLIVIGSGALARSGEDSFDALKGFILYRLSGTATARALAMGKELDPEQVTIDIEAISTDPEVERLRAQIEALLRNNRRLSEQFEQVIVNQNKKSLVRANSLGQLVQSNYGNAVGFQTKVEGGTAYIDKNLNIFPFTGNSDLNSEQHSPIESLLPDNIPRRRAVQFVGRNQELDRLHHYIQQASTSNITAISGMAGVGKSELALQYALSYSESYPGGICWIQARDVDIDIQIITFAKKYLNINPPDDINIIEQVIFCWLNWNKKNSLIIFDDVIDYTKNKCFLPPLTAHFKVLLTTRLRLEDSVTQIRLETLSEDNAIFLLKTLIGEDRIIQELDVANLLCRWLGFLPLGLKLVGQYLANKPNLSLAKILQKLDLKSLKLQISNPDLEVNLRWSISASIELTWQELDHSDKELSYLLSLFALAPIYWELVEEFFPNSDRHALKNQRMNLLHLSLLISNKKNNTYQLHPLIREFFRVKLEQSEQANDLKQHFCQVMVSISKQFPKVASIDLIESFSLAIPHITEASTTLIAWVDNKDMMWLFSVLGNFYTQQSLYSSAEKWYQLCLSTTRSRLGDNHPDVATSLNNLAYLYEAQGKYNEAEALYERALNLNQRLLEEEHPAIISSLNNLAHLYEAQGRLNEAEILYQNALVRNIKLLGEEHPSITASLSYLANLLISQGRYTEAEPLYLKSLKLNRHQLGREHPLVASNLSNLASLYVSQGKYSEAEPLYLQALKIRQKQFSENHPDVASSLNNLAFLYSMQDRYVEAESLYLKSLEMKKRILGKDHPDIATSLSNLAGLCVSQGRYSEAEPLYLRALKIKKQRLGKNHPDIATSLSNLASLYVSQGRSAEAEPLYLQALAMKEMQLSSDHPDIATSLSNLARLYESQGRYSEAEPLYLRALTLVIDILGEEHPNTKIIWQNFLSLISKVIQNNQIEILSNHPLSQKLISQLTEELVSE